MLFNKNEWFLFWEIWSKKMAEDAESDIAIRFVDEND